MGKKSGLIENTVEQATPSARVAVEETPVVETPKQETTIAGYPSRDFQSPLNG